MNLLHDDFLIGILQVIFMQATDQGSNRQKSVGESQHQQGDG